MPYAVYHMKYEIRIWRLITDFLAISVNNELSVVSFSLCGAWERAEGAGEEAQAP